jgi:hypothetical protein
VKDHSFLQATGEILNVALSYEAPWISATIGNISRSISSSPYPKPATIAAMSTKHTFFAKKRNIVLTIVGAFVVLWASVTIVYPMIIGDGLNRYSGVQREVAEGFIYIEKMKHSPLPNLVRVHIDNIRPMTEQERQGCRESHRTNDPAKPGYYTAEYTVGFWGDIKRISVVAPSCMP